MMISAIAGVALENQSTLGQADRAQQLVDDAEIEVEHQPEHGGVGDLADHHRREEGEAEEAARLEQSASSAAPPCTVASAIMTGTWMTRMISVFLSAL